MKEFGMGLVALAIGIAILVGTAFGLIAGWQNMRVWIAGVSGQAEYAQAEQNRKITILEAEANNTAATSRAEAKVKIAEAEASAEVARAKGVAQANAIIGDSLKGNEDYLRYLYITGISAKGSQIIYVPTEGGLPILEAGKR